MKTPILLLGLILSCLVTAEDETPKNNPASVYLAKPTSTNVDLRQLPLLPRWKPGDPIKEIPRRYIPRPNLNANPPIPRFAGAFVDAPSLIQENWSASHLGQNNRAFSSTIISQDGSGNTGVSPPDTVGDVGINYYIHSYNGSGGSGVIVYNKTDGSVAAGPFAMDSLVGAVGSTEPDPVSNCSGGNGDPIILFDELAGRWLLTEFTSSGDAMCIYVSKTGDPITGGWYIYEYIGASFPDYPKYGVWSDAYYIGTNENSTTMYALERDQMLLGNTARSISVTTADLSGFGFQMLVPADHDGATTVQSNAPGMFMRHVDDEVHSISCGGTPAQDCLQIFDFNVDWTVDPPTATVSAPANILISNFNSRLCGLSSFACMEQPGTTNTLDPLREVIMWRLQYRNFGTYETLVANIETNLMTDDPALGAIRWFELRRSIGDITASDWTLYQEGTWNGSPADSTNRWMGSAAMDESGNIGLAYSTSSSTGGDFPSLKYAGRLANDTLGTLTSGENSIVDGSASQTGNTRWGDYASLSVDPVDGCTFWFSSEYTPSSAWTTHLSSFKYDLCGPKAIRLNPDNQSIDVCVNPDSVVASPININVVSLGGDGGYTDAVGLGFNPILPTGITAGYSPTSINASVDPGTATALTLTIDNSATEGLNTVTVEATGTGITAQTFDISVKVAKGLSSTSVLSLPIDGAAEQFLTPAFSWNANGTASSYLIEIATDLAFSNVVESATVSNTNFTPSSSLTPNTAYYWRVSVINSCGTNISSDVFLFVTDTQSVEQVCSAPNAAIPDKPNGQNPGLTNTLSATGTFNIADIDVSLLVDHTFVGDLIFTLSHNATDVIIFNRPGRTGGNDQGCGGDNIDTLLDDSAALPVEDQCLASIPTIDGTYSPNNPLSAFNGQSMNGTWSLNITDNVKQDVGTLREWCLDATDGVSVPADYSDLKSSYGAAWHSGGGVFMLGTEWSADISFGEDSDTLDDGIIASGDWTIGSSSANIEATVNSAGYLACWFDWNNDGSFDGSEQTIGQSIASGGVDIAIAIPAGSTFEIGTDDFLETRCRLYDSEPITKSTESPLGSASSGEVEDFRLPAASLTPVSLAYTKALSGKSGFKLDWSTTTEAGAIAFNVYGLEKNTWVLLNNRPIGAKGINSVIPQDYTFSLAGSQISQYKIEEITTKGKSITYGPYVSNIEHGKYPEVKPINWENIAKASQAQSKKQLIRNKAGFDFIKVSVNKTGVQRITYDQLLSAGVEWQGVNSDEISLTFENVAIGRFVSDAIFGPGSYIEFVGLATKTLYTKTNVYELKLNANLVNSVISDTSNNYIVDSSAYYMAKISKEEDLKYSFASPADTPWYFTSLLVRGTPADWNYPLFSPHLLDNGVDSLFKFQAWGGTDFPEDNDHHIQVLLNDQEVSNVVADGLVLISDVVSVDYSLAQNLNSITFRLPADTNSAADLIQLDNYSFEYPSEITTDNDSLHFSPIVNNSLTDFLFSDSYESNISKNLNTIATATHGFVAKGFTSEDLRAYAFDGVNLINFPNSLVVSGGNGFELTLPHMSLPTINYYLTSEENVAEPILSLGSDSSLGLGQPYDYLMISHPDFIETLSQLVSYHENNGLSVLVVDVNDIYAQYSYHRIDAHAIGSFIADAASQSGIQSVLLVGADSYDYLDNLGIGSISFVPTLYFPTDDVIKYTPVDSLLADTDNNLIPDLAIGRLPARTSQELQNMLNKILSFDSRSYTKSAVFASDRSLLFDNSSDQLMGALPGDWQIETAYINQLELAAAKATLINALESGVSVTNFFGHSGPYTWSFEHLFDTDDLLLLNNANKPSLINQFGCWSTYHVMPQYSTMAHSFMELENKGAVSVLGASTLTDSSHESMLGNYLMPLMTQIGMPTGQAILQAKTALANTNPDYLDVILGWTLLGDPMLILNQE